MTEKHYGGASNFGMKEKQGNTISKEVTLSEKKKEKNEKSNSDNIEIENYKKAGKIVKEAIAFAKSIIKPNTPLLEIAEQIEAKIIELGGKPAFPINLSINEIAAHATPAYNSEEKARGLLKVDLGVHIDGCVADTAFSLDLENDDENKKLIEAAEEALKNAVEKIQIGIALREIGGVIEQTIKSKGFHPIQNLSGHSMNPWDLHSGITIPNFDNSQEKTIEEGAFAIEPFSTTGLGAVRDGKPSGIYHLERAGAVRDKFARSVLEFISDEYQTLPFCSRWIHKQFGTRGLLALRQIEQAGLLHHYPQLIERGSGKVAQAEHTILLTKEKKIVTTI